LTPPILSLRGFGAAFGETLILAEIDLDVLPMGVNVLMGPAGAGKSTLLRTIAGFNEAQPSFHVWGEAIFAGAPLASTNRPLLVAQKASLVMASVFDNLAVGLPNRGDLTRSDQRALVIDILLRAGLGPLEGRLDEPVVGLPLFIQRRIAIARTAAAEPLLLCLDEPTAGLDDDEASSVLDLIADEASRRAVMVVTHNQRRAAVLGGMLTLIAGGRVQEHAPTLRFLRAPSSAAGRDFVRSGSCSVPSPSASRESLAPDVEPPPPPPAAAAESHYAGPRGFHWVTPRELAGTPRPGLLVDVEFDLDALRQVGITLLVCLEERRPIPDPLLANYGITGLFFPIDDMQAPDLEDAEDFCRTIESRITQGEIVAFHCRAGHGRTGTMLAAQLIYRGGDPLETLERIRRVQPRWVQSVSQIEFLSAFAQRLASRRARPLAALTQQ